jgi:hypothetical protein
MTKQFKIGEYAVGGIIKVDIIADNVHIDALDYNTKRPIPFVRESFKVSDLANMDEMLNNLTTSYYADKILSHIKNNK